MNSVIDILTIVVAAAIVAVIGWVYAKFFLHLRANQITKDRAQIAMLVLMAIGILGGGYIIITSQPFIGPNIPTAIPSVVEVTESPPLEAPLIDPAGPELNIVAGQNLAINAEAKGADRYKWTLQGDGMLDATSGPSVLYTAPNEGATAIITVTAYNNQGASPSSSIVINVLRRMKAIELDSLGIPAGWFGGDSPSDFIDVQGGKESECRTSAACLRITYRVGGSLGGFIWWPVGCGTTGNVSAWDQVKAGTCGINILESSNLRVVDQLTFWARGEGGGEVIEFKVGAGDILPSPGRSLGKVTLTLNWNQYEIDLVGMDLNNVVALFSWIAADTDNPQGAVFYLSEIRFEGVE